MSKTRKPLEDFPERRQIHAVENKIEDDRQDDRFWNRNLTAMVSGGGIKDAHVFASFVQEKKRSNDIRTRFDLLTEHPDFRGIVSDVDLGTVTSFDTISELDALKYDFEILLKHIQQKEHASVDLISREHELGRSFDVRQTNVTDEHLIVGRNRILALGRVATDVPLQFAVAKRMVFELPKALYLELSRHDVAIRLPATMQRFESRLDSNDENIYPIRTAYSATSRLIAE